MKRILWFSRHEMTEEQLKALGEAEVKQIDKTIQHASELSAEIEAADVIAVVAPIGLQAEFLKLAGNKPVIVAASERVFVKSEDGTESKVEFKFLKWERIRKIEVVKEDYHG